MINLRWFARTVEKDIDRHIRKRMLAIVLFLEGAVKKAISKGNVTGKTPSKPGEPPRVVTGTLRANVTHDISIGLLGAVGFVGVRKGPASKYAPLLEEEGIRDGTTRPFLRTTLLKNRVQILKLLG